MVLMRARPKTISVMNDNKSSSVSQDAITFIELLLVILIIGILAGISIPQLRKTFDNFELENFVKDIYYLNRYLQASAIGRGRIQCLNIIQDEGKFWATYKENDKPQKIEGRFGKDYKAPEGTVVFIEPPERTTIYFYPDGSIDKVKITLENRHKRQISIATQGIIGDIKIQ